MDIAVNKYFISKVLLYTSIISLFFQILYAFYSGISITTQAIPIILIYGLIILLGYLCYVNALKNIPIGLTALLENLDLFIVLIGLFEAIYYIFGTIGYIYETPIIVNIIQEIRVFLLVILSVIFKTDKMNLKKAIAILLGMISITGIYFI